MTHTAGTHHCAEGAAGIPTYCSQEINRDANQRLQQLQQGLQSFSINDPWALENSCALQSGSPQPFAREQGAVCPQGFTRRKIQVPDIPQGGEAV